MGTENIAETEIRKLQHPAEAEICARIMANSEPWITLQRNFDASLRITTDPSREIYLATVNGEIVGFTILLIQGAFIGYIQSVCVAPGWRSKGIGSQPMAFAEKRIFSETPNVIICVSSFNKGAQRLYERFGYEVIGELKDYIISGHSEILLRKTIAPMAEFKKE
ncbi:MAG: N-acetyltransferase [Spirochaetota bacterium]